MTRVEPFYPAARRFAIWRSTIPPVRRVPIWLLAVLATVIGARPAPALEPGRELTQYLHRIWQVQQGLPQSSIYCVTQTQDGYLWLGTQTGIVRFDGVRFARIADTGNAAVQTMVEDPSHHLWAGTAGAGVIELADGVEVRRYQREDGLGSNTVNAMLCDRAGKLWVCTPVAVVTFDRGSSRFETEQDLTAANCRAICQAPDGTIWLGGDGPRLIAWTNSGSERIQPLPSLPAQSIVMSLATTTDGTIWAGTTAGLLRMSDGRRFTTADALADNTVISLDVSATDGTVWAGTKNGFSRIRGDDVESFQAADGLSQSTAFSVFEDHEGSLWIGTKHGLNQFLDRRLVPYTTSEGLPSNNTGPVLQDRAGNVWVGTLDAGLTRFDGHRFSSITTQQGLPSNSIYALAEDRDGALWVGTDHGLTRLRNGAVDRTFTASDGLNGDAIDCLLCDNSGVLWVGTNSGVCVLRGGRLERVPLDDPSAIVALGQYGDAVIAATESRGTIILSNATASNPVTQAGVNADAFFTDRDGLLWIGATGGNGGLRLLNGQKITNFTTSDGLFDDDIYGIVADDQDRLWMACSKGIFWVNRAELRKFATGEVQRVVSNPFSPTEALRTIECKPGVQPCACRTADGHLWFSTIRGVIVVDSNHLDRKLGPAPAVIEEAIVNGKDENPALIAAMPPGIKNIQFRYTGLSYLSPTRINFRYQLEPFDKEWVDAGTRRDAFYTNLPPGTYTFRVAAANVDGSFSEPASVSFALAAHYYQQAWFWPACVAVAGLLAWSAYRWRLRLVRQRWDAIITERSRIARELHDTLLQGFSGVTMEMQAVAARLPSQSSERAALSEIIADAGNAMREARRSVAGLRAAPQQQGQASLAAALRDASRQIIEPTDIRLHLDVEPAPTGLPPEVEYHLLRIGTEAVTNAAKHSGARSIEVVLKNDASRVNLRVKDDGRGFRENGNGSEAGHYGIIGMRERASQIGADFELDTRPGYGTTVNVIVPRRTTASE
jgi:signal transduction histidine kinase/ligand-binding sensor domain-containing protein